MKKWNFFIVSFIVLAFAAPLWLGLFPLDFDEVDTMDLQVEIVLPELNAYDFLIQLEEGRELELLDAAAEADAYLEPGLAEDLSWETAVPTLTGYMDAMRVSVAEARRLVEEGDLPGAEEELERSLVVTQMIQDAPGTLIQSLIAMTAKTLLLETVAELDLDMNLGSFSDNELGLIQAYKVEFLLAETVVNDIAIDEKEAWFQTGYHLQTNRTIAEFARITRANIEALKSEESVDHDLEDLGELRYFGFNSLGEFLIKGLTPRTDGVILRMQELDSF